MQTIGRHNPSETSVEHDLVSADWLKTSGRGAQAWNRLGSAIRQAQELGLHDIPDTIEPAPGQDVEPHLLAVWQLEHQKRLWTRLFIFDANLAMGLGRPRIIHREDAVIPTLLNCDFPYDTAKIIPVPYEDCSFASTIFLLHVAHKIHDVLSILSNRARRNDYLAIMALHDEICELRSTMPKFNSVGLTSVDRLRSSVSYLRLVNHINTVIIALHRPFIASQPTSRALAVSAALDQLDTQEDLFQILPFPQFKLYGNVFYTIDASVFLAGVVTELPAQGSDTYHQIQKSIQKAIARLKVMKQRNRIACSAEEMLRHFYHKMNDTQSASTTRVDQATRDSSGVDDSAVDNIIATISPLQQHSFETYESLFNFDSGFDKSVDLGVDPHDTAWIYA
ncbi:hypothetical protein LTR05_006870 [Lithohypha guttulata]|uniref:Xylanolytic transcriptional activator regulatory domain-containing protein n=1 Tax=Lithohypha guttulata TaxID=1690604 RepID=A0AAN7YEU9_9EURO|nr:hypothetical protein LTR05_006870 [Lithohypha guttulata]